MESTDHHIYFSNANNMREVADESVDLVITSPPYPMIEMWDEIFAQENPIIADALKKGDGFVAFQLMHNVLNKIWQEVKRVLKPGGIICINIGDATRKLTTDFRLYPNHANIIHAFADFTMLPLIIWRKQTNKPNKFMGSGMLPTGAYVTLEHEYILIFRKAGRRQYSNEEKLIRHRSAFFWEERNTWFSDIWTDLKGTSQLLNGGPRERSAAYPFELAYRLISMFSLQGETVCDPFIGTGTTMLAAMVAGRNSIGYEIDGNLSEVIQERIKTVHKLSETVITNRLSAHQEYMQQRIADKKIPKYTSIRYNFPVISKQEVNITLPLIDKTTSMITNHNSYHVKYRK